MSLTLLRRLAALGAAYAIALQAIAMGVAAPPFDPAFGGDLLAVVCAGAGTGEQPAPAGRHETCALCVMPGGCGGHALPTHDTASVVPGRFVGAALPPFAYAQVVVAERKDRTHGARAPPAVS